MSVIIQDLYRLYLSFMGSQRMELEGAPIQKHLEFSIQIPDLEYPPELSENLEGPGDLWGPIFPAQEITLLIDPCPDTREYFLGHIDRLPKKIAVPSSLRDMAETYIRLNFQSKKRKAYSLGEVSNNKATSKTEKRLRWLHKQFFLQGTVV